MMQAFGGYGAYVEDPKNLRGLLDEAMNFPGPVVNIKLNQGSARKAEPFRWHSYSPSLTFPRTRGKVREGVKAVALREGRPRLHQRGESRCG